eukprot:9593486-Ditylum_brightwellii.AAC.1
MALWSSTTNYIKIIQKKPSKNAWGLFIKPISCGAPRGCSRQPWAGVRQFLWTLQNNYCLKDGIENDWAITQDTIPVHASTTNGRLNYSITAIPSVTSESTPRPSTFDEYIQHLPYWERSLFS